MLLLLLLDLQRSWKNVRRSLTEAGLVGRNLPEEDGFSAVTAIGCGHQVRSAHLTPGAICPKQHSPLSHKSP